MLARHQVKTPIILLLVLTSMGELCLISGVIQSGVGGYIGILMESSLANLCSNTYLSIKVEALRTYMYNIIFFCACGAAAVGVALLISLLMLVSKLMESQTEKFPNFSLQTFYNLYILYSLALLLTIPGAGYYLTLFIEKGNACTTSYQLHWFAIGILFMAALIFIFICWLYLFILKLQLQDCFQQKLDQTQKKPLINVVMNEPTIANVLDLIMMEQKLKDKQEEKSQIKEPLVESLDSDDQASVQEGEKQKIACVDFGAYKRKQQAQRMREAEEQNIILQLMAMQQEKRNEIEKHEAEERFMQAKKQKKISNMALSPDDEDFDKIFEESEQQVQENLVPKAKSPPPTPQSQQQELFYPANYVPKDQEDEKRFKQYKKRLLAKYNVERPQGKKRHLQNIQGGRSKRQLMRAVNAHKKPPRTIEYYENMLKSSYVATILEVPNSEYTSEVQDSSATFNFKTTEEIRELPSMMVIPEKQPEIMSERRYFGEEEEPPQRLVFEKRAEKSPLRKKLFDEQVKYLKNMNMGSVLGTLVKGVVESTHRTRLTQLREEREGETAGKRKKNERLIDFIRSKYN